MIALLLAVALGQTPGPLTLDEAQRQAIAHQPVLQQAKFDRDVARARVTQARAIEFPQLHADAQALLASDDGLATAYLSPADFARVSGSKAFNPASPEQPFLSSLAGVGAHYDVLDFGYSRGTVGAAESNEQADAQLEKQTLQDVLLRVSSAYFGALAAQEALGVANDTLKRAETDDAFANAGVRAGLRPPIDRARSEAELQAAKLGVIRATNALEVSRAALDTAIGWIPPGEYSLAEPADDLRAVPEAADASNQALAARFDLAALQAEEQAVRFQRESAFSGHFPRLLATSSLSLRGFASAPDTFNYDVGLTLDVPLFTGFAVSGAVDEADARLAALEAREAALRQAIGYQLRQSRDTLLSAREAVKASAAQVDAAKASLAQAQVRYQQGLGNIVELTDAEAQFDVAQLGLVQSHLDAAVSRVQLDYAMGQLRAP